jgi:hypothetical protein
VVAQSHGIESQLIDRLCNLLALVVGEKHCTLELITRIQQQTILLGGSLLIQHILYPSITTKAALCRIRTIRAGASKLIQMRVHIIDMVERDVVVSLLVDETLLQVTRDEMVFDDLVAEDTDG